jgi:hypothetical protein|tara:strand:+ start:134 stop:358 length:225 start_codon:yes stop_codon:yes gene_type:complete
MGFPTKGYKELTEDCPEIPGNTCPHIDKAQQHLEELRDQNEALRDAGKYWRTTAMHLLQECCDLNRYIRELEDK